METQDITQETSTEHNPQEQKDVDVLDSNYIQFLTFNVGNETYGIDISNVKEVIEYATVYPIPRIPSYIRGVTNLRGEVIPVVDLNSRFYGNSTEVGILTGIVFVEVLYRGKTVILGIIIDEVNAVTKIYEKDINSIPEFGIKIRYDFISNIGKVDDKFIVLLNIEKVLDIDELSELNDVNEEEVQE